MAGFIRRYGFFPGAETIALIEGVVIVDLPPPGSVQGVGTGTVGLVGEFTDVSTAVSVDSNGNVNALSKPVEIFSGQDLINKMGGFDPSLGQFGDAMGNGFVALRNKKFRRLVCQAVNLASPQATRMWRTLPTNTSLTSATPTVPMQAAVVAAGAEFRSGANRVRAAKRTSFTDDAAFVTGVDGVVAPAGLPLATQTFDAVTGQFVVNGVKEGDALVLGQLPPTPTSITDNPLTAIAVVANVVSTSGYPAAGFLFIDAEAIQYTAKTATSFTGLTRGALGTVAAAHVLGSSVALLTSAGTYRVVGVVDADTLTLERQDGSNFTVLNWIAETAQPWRLHVGRTADTGPDNQLSEVAGYTVPARPLDATIAQATSILPTVAAAAPSRTSWDPLAGLTMRTHPTAPGLAFDATVQGANPVNVAGLDALYSTAIDAFLSQDLPEREVNIIGSSRSSTVIRAKLKSHVLDASSVGVGRSAVVSPPLSTQNIAVASGDVAPGVGATRDERVWYAWPGAQTFVPEAVNSSIAKANGGTTTDGILDVQGDMWLGAVCSNLPPERNPGQAAPPVPDVLAPVLGLQRGVVGLGINQYITLRQRGVVGLRIDRTVGPIFQSGVTSSLISGQKNISRRRMADFVEDSLAQRLVQFAKLPLTQSLKDAAVGETVAFLNQLLSPNNPAAQRINDFEVDPASGNTPDMEAQGIFVIIVRVRTLPSADFIVLQAEVGENVRIVRTT